MHFDYGVLIPVYIYIYMVRKKLVKFQVYGVGGLTAPELRIGFWVQVLNMQGFGD